MVVGPARAAPSLRQPPRRTGSPTSARRSRTAASAPTGASSRRGMPGALIQDPALAAARARDLAARTTRWTRFPRLHGDTHGALAIPDTRRPRGARAARARARRPRRWAIRALRFALPAGTSRRALLEALRRSPAIEDAVLAEEVGLVTFSAPEDRPTAEQAVVDALGVRRRAPRVRLGFRHRIEVVYDGEDLDEVARTAGLTARASSGGTPRRPTRWRCSGSSRGSPTSAGCPRSLCSPGAPRRARASRRALSRWLQSTQASTHSPPPAAGTSSAGRAPAARSPRRRARAWRSAMRWSSSPSPRSRPTRSLRCGPSESWRARGPEGARPFAGGRRRTHRPRTTAPPPEDRSSRARSRRRTSPWETDPRRRPSRSTVGWRSSRGRPCASRTTRGAWRELAPGETFETAPGGRSRCAYLGVGRRARRPECPRPRGTLLVAGLGGVDGRPLRKGDVLAMRAGPRPADARPRWTRASAAHLATEEEVVVLPGPDADEAALVALRTGTFRISPSSDRTGRASRDRHSRRALARRAEPRRRWCRAPSSAPPPGSSCSAPITRRPGATRVVGVIAARSPRGALRARARRRGALQARAALTTR